MGSDSDKEKYYAPHCRWTNKSHAHLRNDLPFHSLQVQIILPAALKMMMVWQCGRLTATTLSVDIAP